uniref:C2H2-type domain-containing protein n=1 Tax=Psilocybe cubensis TaxID=181762 RepID=A0A8H7XKR9_PSICU
MHKCTECTFETRSACALKVHIRSQHTDEKDLCPFDDCLFATADPSLMSRHKRSVHPEFVPARRARTIPIGQVAPAPRSDETSPGPSRSTYRRRSTRRKAARPIDTLTDLSVHTSLPVLDAGSPKSSSSFYPNIPSSSTPSSSKARASDVPAQEMFPVPYASHEEMSGPMLPYNIYEEQVPYQSTNPFTHYIYQPFPGELTADQACYSKQPQYPNTTPFSQFSYQTHPGYEAIGFPAQSASNQDFNSFIFPPLHSEDVDLTSAANGGLSIDPSLLAVDEYLQAASMFNALEETSPFNKGWCSEVPYLGSWADSIQLPLVPSGNVAGFGSLDGPSFLRSMDGFNSQSW